jgi:hypothetical protein
MGLGCSRSDDNNSSPLGQHRNDQGLGILVDCSQKRTAVRCRCGVHDHNFAKIGVRLAARRTTKNHTSKVGVGYPRRAFDGCWLSEKFAIDLGPPQIAVAIPFLPLMGVRSRAAVLLVQCGFRRSLRSVRIAARRTCSRCLRLSKVAQS